MKKSLFIVIALVLSCNVSAALAIPPHDGFEWRTLANGAFELQVPKDWHGGSKTQGIVQMFYLSPEEGLAHGFNTGFTLNFIRCKNKKEMNDATGSALTMIKEHGDAFGKPINQKVIENDDMTYLMIEGERFLDTAPMKDQKYRIRIVAQILKRHRAVFIYSFGALVADWEEQWKKGVIMFNPILINQDAIKKQVR